MPHNLSRLLIIGGSICLLIGLLFLLWLYWPVVTAEVQYRFVWSKQTVPTIEQLTKAGVAQQVDKKPELVPINTSFSITIPKLYTSAPVIANVDSQDSNQYQRALQRGVAHAAGSAFPNSPGTTFLFAHSSANQLIAQQYNAVFYLLNKLEKDDDILVYYAGEPFHYKVTKREVVEPDQVDTLGRTTGPQQLVLMTCTPAGTTARRLLVSADLVPTASLPTSFPVID